MNHTFPKSQNNELVELVEAVGNNTITEDQGARLAEILKSDKGARAYYIQSMMLNAALQREFEEPAPVGGSIPAPQLTESNISSINEHTQPAPKTNIIPWIGGGIAAAAALTLAWTQFANNSPEPNKPSPIADNNTGNSEVIEKRQVRTVARITASDSARWLGNQPTYPVGSWLEPGAYELASGDVEITFDCGTSMTVTAGSKFEVISQNQGKILHGDYSISSPDSEIKFEMATANGALKELNGVCLVNSSIDGKTVVQMESGKVLLAHGKTSTLIDHENPVHLKGGKLAPHSKKLSRRQIASAKFGRVPTNFIHYNFDGSELNDGQVLDSGYRVDEGSYDGAIYESKKGFQQVEGPFGKAIEFNGNGAAIRTGYAGVNGATPRTISFWIKVPEKSSKNNSYAIASWGLSKPGKKWQVAWNTNLFGKQGNEGAIRTEFGGGYIVGSRDLRDGKWHHITSVYLGGVNGNTADRIRLYVDGKLEKISGSLNQKIDTETQGEPLMLGSLIEDISRSYNHGFRGALDEFYLFEAALTPRQVRKLYKQNVPPEHSSFVPSHFVQKQKK